MYHNLEIPFKLKFTCTAVKYFNAFEGTEDKRLPPRLILVRLAPIPIKACGWTVVILLPNKDNRNKDVSPSNASDSIKSI